MLHDILKPPGHPSLPRRRGHKWSLPLEGQLGLLLFYISSTMNYKYLCNGSDGDDGDCDEGENLFSLSNDAPRMPEALLSKIIL